MSFIWSAGSLGWLGWSQTGAGRGAGPTHTTGEMRWEVGEVDTQWGQGQERPQRKNIGRCGGDRVAMPMFLTHDPMAQEGGVGRAHLMGRGEGREAGCLSLGSPLCTPALSTKSTRMFLNARGQRRCQNTAELPWPRPWPCSLGSRRSQAWFPRETPLHEALLGSPGDFQVCGLEPQAAWGRGP